MVDFIAECSFHDQSGEVQPEKLINKRLPTKKGNGENKVGPEIEGIDHWLVYMDGSSAQEGNGARILLIDPKKEEFKYFIRFKFSVTNNVTEYEALLLRLKLAKKIQAGKITIYIDSQLVAR